MSSARVGRSHGPAGSRRERCGTAVSITVSLASYMFSRVLRLGMVGHRQVVSRMEGHLMHAVLHVIDMTYDVTYPRYLLRPRLLTR
jgi:hypothetical protein